MQYPKLFSMSSIRVRNLTDERRGQDEEMVLVSSDDGCEKKNPVLISINAEKMLLIWISKNEEHQEIRYTTFHDQPAKESDTLCATNNAQRVFLGKTREGRIFALWDSMFYGKSTLYFSIFNKQGEYFSGPSLLVSGSGEMFFGDSASVVTRRNEPSILFFTNEKLDILCSVELGDQRTLEFMNFSEPTKVCATSAEEDDPMAIENDEGEIYLFWSSSYNGNNEIFLFKDSNVGNFQEGIQYRRDLSLGNERSGHFADDFIMDPSQQNSNPEGYFCADIFFSTAVIGEELWVAWDSYYWDPIENNNVRKVKYVKTIDGINWSQPITLVDSSKSEKYGRDDRHPALIGTDDGSIWLFWNSDRYVKDENDKNSEICFIRSHDGGMTWDWKVQDEDPFLLTRDPGKDLYPSVSSIGNKIYVVWQSDRYGNWDILLTEFDTEEFPNTFIDNNLPHAYHIIIGDFPDINPSLTTYTKRSLGNLLYTEEHKIVGWETVERDDFSIYLIDLKSGSNISQTPVSRISYGRFPDISYINGSLLSKKILRKGLWVSWESSEFGSNVVNIWCSKRLGEEQNIENMKVTDDFSCNERSQIIKFKGKIWVFWDSSGGGEGRGIYYRYLYGKEFPFPLLILILIGWSLFIWDVSSKIGVAELFSRFRNQLNKWSEKHIRLTDFMIGITIGIITGVITGLLVFAITG